MVDFTENEGRHIAIDGDGDVWVLHGGVEIGGIKFDVDDRPVLWDKFVTPAFQRKLFVKQMLCVSPFDGTPFHKPC